MKKFKFNKLIRNKLPSRMIKEGLVVHDKILSKEEYIFHLKNKLLEETQEVIQEDQKEQLQVELADVIEVIHTFAKECQISLADIEKSRLKKLEINGEFDQHSYIDYIEVPYNNKKVIKYLQNKNKKYILK